MAAWVCDPEQGGCTTVYAVGAPACPHCGNTAAHADHDPDAKIIRDEVVEAVDDQAVDTAPARKATRKSAGRKAGGDGAVAEYGGP